MSVLITTKNPVTGLGPFNDITAKVIHQLQTFTEQYHLEDGPVFNANGRYFYKDATGKEHNLKTWSRTWTAQEANALFTALNVQHPDGATYSQKRQAEKLAALKFATASEGKYGLTINDWE